MSLAGGSLAKFFSRFYIRVVPLRCDYYALHAVPDHGNVVFLVYRGVVRVPSRNFSEYLSHNCVGRNDGALDVSV